MHGVLKHYFKLKIPLSCYLVFSYFYYLNGRLPLTNGLLVVPDDEVPDGKQKINLKHLYEMFKDTNSHGLVSLQFLGALGIFFGLNISVPKNAITKLYKNLSYESLSGDKDFTFDIMCFWPDFRVKFFKFIEQGQARKRRSKKY